MDMNESVVFKILVSRKKRTVVPETQVIKLSPTVAPGHYLGRVSRQWCIVGASP